MNDLDWITDRLPEIPEPGGLATDRARLALLQHVTTQAPAAPLARPLRRRARRIGLVLAGTAAVGAGGAIAISTAPRGGARPAGPHAGLTPRAVRQHGPLIRLADDIVAAPAPPGNATLIERVHTFPNAPGFTWYDLYEDDGEYYSGDTLADLRSSLTVAGGGDTVDGAVLAAAAASANLMPAQALAKMYAARPAPAGPSDTSAAAKQAFAAKIRALRRTRPVEARNLADAPPESHQSVVDNYVWMNAMDALEGGGGRADIRAGAMLALSALPDVQVTHATEQGSDVLEVKNTQFSGGYAEMLTLDAQTGVLVHMEGGTVGGPADVDVAYTTTRVTAPSLDPAH